MTNPELFILAILILLSTPGPTNTLLWASGALVGVQRSLKLLMGELTGYLSAIILILLIFEPITQRFPNVERFLALVVGVYICLLAFRIWVRSNNVAASAELISLRKVFMVTLLNPKSFVFALTIIPIGHPRLHWYFVALGICIILVGFIWIMLGHIIGSTVGRDNLEFFNRFSSVILTGFGGYIIASALN